jgi:hypothetical protein
VEHPEALLLPSKPALPSNTALAYPAHQTIQAQEVQAPIEKVTRQ